MLRRNNQNGVGRHEWKDIAGANSREYLAELDREKRKGNRSKGYSKYQLTD